MNATEQLERLLETLVSRRALCTRENPCGAQVEYKSPDSQKLWRIADDCVSEEFDDFDSALAAAKDWPATR